NVPLAPVNDGQPRSLAGIRIPSSVALNCGDWTDSQADSAGSIPVTRSNVKIQVGRIFRRRLPVSSLFERAVRAINVQLATGADAPVVALDATNGGRLLRLDVRVDRGRNQLIGTASPVLVDDRGPFAVVSHPGHQVPQPGAAYRRKVIPGMA